MVEKEITPRFIEGKKSKAGKKYWSIETPDGETYTCHREPAIIELSKRIGKPCLIDYSQSDDGKWLNLWEVIINTDKKGEPVYANKENTTPEESTPKAEKISTPTDPNTSVVIKRTEKANSYEVGKAGNRFKLYFENAKDLTAKITSLKEAGFILDDDVVQPA